jgi:hypothetical protein
VEDEEARRLYLGDKFSEYGEAFGNLREEVRRKGRDETIVGIGQAARPLRGGEPEPVSNAGKGESGSGS